jgi:hypothetical protein
MFRKYGGGEQSTLPSDQTDHQVTHQISEEVEPLHASCDPDLSWTRPSVAISQQELEVFPTATFYSIENFVGFSKEQELF